MWKCDEYSASERTFFPSPEAGEGSYHPHVLGVHDTAPPTLCPVLRQLLPQVQEGY